MPAAVAEPSPYMRKRLTTGQECAKFLWDPDERSFLGRTAKRWGIAFAFYGVFYAVLALFFSICMWGMLAVIDRQQPYYRLHDSLIGSGPGMGFRPQLQHNTVLVQYSPRNRSQVAEHKAHLDDFLKPYLEAGSAGSAGDFGECTSAADYGYSSAAPCIFIKLNKMFGWEPEYFAPAELPAELRTLVPAAPLSQVEQVWVSCATEKAKDNQTLGPVRYSPSGFPAYSFPYTNQPGYLGPLVAVQLLNPQPGVLINIRCRAWAKNIEYNRSLKDLGGSVHIELMLLESPVEETNTTSY